MASRMAATPPKLSTASAGATQWWPGCRSASVWRRLCACAALSRRRTSTAPPDGSMRLSCGARLLAWSTRGSAGQPAGPPRSLGRRRPVAAQKRAPSWACAARGRTCPRQKNTSPASRSSSRGPTQSARATVGMPKWLKSAAAASAWPAEVVEPSSASVAILPTSLPRELRSSPAGFAAGYAGSSSSERKTSEPFRATGHASARRPSWHSANRCRATSTSAWSASAIFLRSEHPVLALLTHSVCRRS
mmetsp:Transcript_70379/g.218783  ORF Transcript_70379/g.218783 Transcript_70379/m.218783 type:complete len:247 (-) Transcript_70379:366-1106(-)